MSGYNIEEHLDEMPLEKKKRCLEVIAKYGSNKWWKSGDLLEIARYQLFEPILLVEFDDFHEGIELLLGRPVYITEFALNKEGIEEEARTAIAKLDKGESLKQSDQYIQDKTDESFKSLSDYCLKNNKSMIMEDDKGPCEVVSQKGDEDTSEIIMDILEEHYIENTNITDD